MTSLLFESAMRATVIIAAVAVILKIMTIKSAAVRHGVWSGVAVVMLLLPSLIAFGPQVALPILPAGVPQTAVATAPLAVSLRNTGNDAQSVPTAPGRIMSPQSRNWPTLLFAVYLLGVGTLLLRLGVGALHMRRLIRGAVVRHGRLMHVHCATPMTVGWFHPVVILPANWLQWPQDQLEAIELHENAHVMRRDPLLKGVALINRAVFWFHPLAWWLDRHVSALAEEACDVVVLSRGHDPRRYAQYLLDAARSASRAGGRVALGGMAMPGTNLPYRIRKILKRALPPRISRPRLISAMALCAAVMAIGSGATLVRAEAVSSSLDKDMQPNSSRPPSLPALTSRDPAERAAMAMSVRATPVRAESSQSSSLSAPTQSNSGQLSPSLLALTSLDPAQRAAAACEFGRMGNEARAAIPALIAMLDDGAPLPRQIFCGTDPPFEDESWAPEHAEVLEPSPGEAATRALLAIGSEATMPLKETLVGAAHWRARKNAAWAFAHRGQGTDELIAALTDPAWQVRTEAAYALAQRGGNSRGVIEALSTALLDDTWQVREQAVLALGNKRSRDADTRQLLVAALQDGDPRVRLAATATLWQRADQDAWQPLFDALRDVDQSVRTGAASAMGNRARDPEVQRLIAARHDPDPRIREGVREALRIVDQRMRGTTTNLTRIQIPVD